MCENWKLMFLNLKHPCKNRRYQSHCPTCYHYIINNNLIAVHTICYFDCKTANTWKHLFYLQILIIIVKYDTNTRITLIPVKQFVVFL